MSESEDDLTFSPENFSGRARLFPLPNLVLFPHVIQPLHIFERRYVDLLHDAIEGDRLITMALLEPGWQEDYEGRPPIARVACLGRVLTWQAQPNQRYNVLLLGLRRVRVLRELPACRSFREAEVEILNDCCSSSSGGRRTQLHQKLVSAFEKSLPSIRDAEELFSNLSVDTISLGTLTDVIGYALDLNVQTKQGLLAEPDVDRRAKKLLTLMKQMAGEGCQLSLAAGFPPAFSSN
jgi:uncharacterized protein